MTLILVAARNGAALFEHTARGGLQRLEDIPGPADVAPLDDPRAFDADAERRRYTGALADRLEAGVERGAEAIILMAEARLLGAIRMHLSAPTAQRIQASLNVASPDWDEASLGVRLGPLLDEKRSATGRADFF